MSVEEYRKLLLGSWDWSIQQANAAAGIWWEAAILFVETNGDETVLSDVCGSPGEWAGGADRLADFFMREGYDPYPLWDLFLAVDEYLDNPDNIPVDTIRRLCDRSSLMYRRLYIMAEEAEGREGVPKPSSGRPKSDRVLKIESAIAEGEHDEDIARRFNINDAYVRTIKWRMKQAKS